MKYFNQNKHLNDEGIALFVDALKLNKQEHLPESVQNHVENCEPCHQEIIELYAVMSTISYENRSDHPSLEPNTEAKSFSIRRYLLPIAAAAAAIAGIGFFFFNQNDAGLLTSPEVVLEEVTTPELKEAPTYTIEKVDTNEIKTIPAPAPRQDKTEAIVKTPQDQVPKTPKIKDWKDPEKKASSRELFAMNFTPAEDLESLVDEVFRSDDLNIQLPENKDVYRPDSRIPFAWNGSEQQLTLVILNNQEEEIHSAELQTSSYLWTPNVDPGIYYWKLETEDDLLHVGQFFIE